MSNANACGDSPCSIPLRAPDDLNRGKDDYDGNSTFRLAPITKGHSGVRREKNYILNAARLSRDDLCGGVNAGPYPLAAAVFSWTSAYSLSEDRESSVDEKDRARRRR